MYSKKVIRYYSDCGKGFWKKNQAISHDLNCVCWKNPKFKTCLTCVNKCIVNDSNGMELEPHLLQNYKTNNCKHSELGVPSHSDFDFIRKYCPKHELKTK